MAKKTRRPLLILFLTLSLFAGFFPQAGEGGETSDPTPLSFEPKQVLISFRPWVSDSEKALASRRLGAESLLPEVGETGFRAVRVGPRIDPATAVLRLSQDPRVEQAELNYKRHAVATPDDPLYATQWTLPKIEAEPGWETVGNEVIVAIVDTGVDLDHPDLAAKIVPGFNFVDNNDRPMDDNGHGTHVAGIAAAIGNNGLGVAGVSWSSKIMPIKVLDANGTGNDYQAAQGIIWAVDHGAKVINLSFGGLQHSSLLQEAVNYAHERGAVIVAAAGNEALNGNPPFYPAALDNVIAVGALDASDSRASFSGFGYYLDVSAPGVSVMSTALDNDYRAMTGTSMASPHVAGQASLLLALRPDQTNTQVEEIIKQTAWDLGESGRDDVFGHGRISISRSLASVQPASPGTGTIEGTIMTADGRPAVGAKAETAGKAALADSSGDFSLSGLSEGTYDVTYSSPGFNRQLQQAIPLGQGTTRVPTVVLSLAHGEIRGRVLGYRGKPLRGAVIRIDQVVSATDGKGRFRFTSLEEGLYTIYYDASGYHGQIQNNIAVTGGVTVAPTAILAR
jgi:subtilisin family serine protease